MITKQTKIRNILIMACDTTPQGIILRNLCSDTNISFVTLKELFLKYMPEVKLELDKIV